MREIKNGRLGRMIMGGGVQFDALDLWRNISALGGTSTQAVLASYNGSFSGTGSVTGDVPSKGQPPQATSHSLQAVAATIPNQALIDPYRRA